MATTEDHRGQIRVVHILRDDHATHTGGDLVQLRETVAGLRAEGIDAIAASLSEAPDEIDIVHLYNVQLPDQLLSANEAARRRWPNAAFVISPILAKTSLDAFRSREPLIVAKAARAIVGDIVRAARARRALASADAVIVNSEGERGALKRLFGVADGVVAHNGVTIERWPARTGSVDRPGLARRLGLDPGSAVLIACVGRLEPLKNQVSLIRAIDHVPGGGLALVGPDGHPSYSARVHALAASRPGRVVLTGSMDQAALASVLSDIDVHVLPSFRESFGLVNLEAAACGCEVVADRSGYTREWMGDAVAYADMASPTSIAAAIAEVQTRPRQPRLRTLVERLTWRAAARAVAECYRRVWAARRS